MEIPWELIHNGGVAVLACVLYFIWKRVETLHQDNRQSIEEIYKKIRETKHEMRGVLQSVQTALVVDLKEHQAMDDKTFNEVKEKLDEAVEGRLQMHGSVEGMRAEVRGLTVAVNRLMDTGPRKKTNE